MILQLLLQFLLNCFTSPKDFFGEKSETKLFPKLNIKSMTLNEL